MARVSPTLGSILLYVRYVYRAISNLTGSKTNYTGSCTEEHQNGHCTPATVSSQDNRVWVGKCTRSRRSRPICSGTGGRAWRLLFQVGPSERNGTSERARAQGSLCGTCWSAKLRYWASTGGDMTNTYLLCFFLDFSRTCLVCRPWLLFNR